jgi:hypothetical protein
MPRTLGKNQQGPRSSSGNNLQRGMSAMCVVGTGPWIIDDAQPAGNVHVRSFVSGMDVLQSRRHCDEGEK